MTTTKHKDSLPEPYEEVFIWWNSNSGVQRRVARLDATKTFFQLSTYNGAAKSQYLAPIREVLAWAPLADGNVHSEVVEALTELVDYLSDKSMPITGPMAALERSRAALIKAGAA